ncbi:hypothetical protein [Bacillus sp. AK031]
MNKVILKIAIIIILIGILTFMLLYEKTDDDGSQTDKVTLVEKYYSPSDSSVASGVKTNKEIKNDNQKEKKCIVEFSNKKIFDVACDKYLDYRIGDQVIITYNNNKLIKMGKK